MSLKAEIAAKEHQRLPVTLEAQRQAKKSPRAF